MDFSGIRNLREQGDNAIIQPTNINLVLIEVLKELDYTIFHYLPTSLVKFNNSNFTRSSYLISLHLKKSLFDFTFREWTTKYLILTWFKQISIILCGMFQQVFLPFNHMPSCSRDKTIILLRLPLAILWK